MLNLTDGEFHRDWKKLTFYYYADSYVNFNNLVTDLFKAYKTRIWMSAINPDSFVSPAPTGMPGFRGRDRFDLGPNPDGNGMGYSNNNTSGDMQQQQQHLLQQHQQQQQQPYNDWSVSQEMMSTPAMAPSAYGHFFPSQAQGYPNMTMLQPDFGRGGYPGYRDPSPSNNIQPQQHQQHRQQQQQQFGAATRHSGNLHSPYDGQGSGSGSGYNDQLKAFQGLSLGP